MELENIKLRKAAIKDAYCKLEKLEPGSREYGTMVEAICRLEQSEREDDRAEASAILEDRKMDIEEQKVKKTKKEWLCDIFFKGILPSALFYSIQAVIIPRAEKNDYVPPLAKSLDPKRCTFWK